jgi:Protein of unknown function (DUF416)
MIGNDKSQVSVATLSQKKQLAFALLVFERMLPSLIAFSKATGFNDSCHLQAKDAAWAALQNGPVDRSLIETCLNGAPDPDDYSHELASRALDAALVMNDIVEFTQDGCFDHITRVSMLAGDSVDGYLGNLNDSTFFTPEVETWIASHPLMLEKHRREEDDLGFVASLPEPFSDETILCLKKRADSQPPLLPLRL